MDVKLQLLVRVSGPFHLTRGGARRMFYIYKRTEGTQKFDFNEQWTPQFLHPVVVPWLLSNVAKCVYICSLIHQYLTCQ